MAVWIHSRNVNVKYEDARDAYEISRGSRAGFSANLQSIKQ